MKLQSHLYALKAYYICLYSWALYLNPCIVCSTIQQLRFIGFHLEPLLFLYLWVYRAYSRNLGQHLVLARKGTFSKKRVPEISPYSIPFLSVLHQNKVLHNFPKREQHPTVGCIKGIDLGLMGHFNMVGAKAGVAACINEIESI